MSEITGPATPEHRRAVPVPDHPGIFRKGSRYQVRWRHYGRQQARSFRTLTEAVRFKAKTVAGDTRPLSRQPFKRYAAAWLDGYAGRTARGLTERTRESYRDAVERLAIPFFKTTPLDKIDPPLLRAYIDHLAGKGLAPASVRRVYAPVRAMLATAYEDGLVSPNPAAGVRVIVADNRPHRRKRLTPDETRALLAAMPAEHADFTYFLAATGCRIGEALAARWQDVQQGANGGPALTIPKAKTVAGQRTIPLTPETVRRLTKRRAEAAFSGPGDYIFASPRGTRPDDHNFRHKVFNPARKAAGVPWATPHGLRHGVATLMVEHGYSAAQVAAHLGHADRGVLALRTYVHAEPLPSVDFLDAALTGTA